MELLVFAFRRGIDFSCYHFSAGTIPSRFFPSIPAKKMMTGEANEKQDYGPRRA
jgi:hypothetical protein